MTLAIEVNSSTKFSRFVDRVNRRPMVWTIALMIPTYCMSLSLTAMAMISDPFLYSPVVTFLILLVAASFVMSFHWFFSRHQRSSNTAQIIQFVAGFIPVFGGFCIVVISRMSV
ncbi:hypothetical protein OAU68_02325 [Litorivicinus sp.]|nr:hypothetical protein [Litorivicinus sp.]